MVLLIVTSSLTVLSLLLTIETPPLIFPGASEVASVFDKSPTVTVTSPMPALESAVSMAFWISSLVVSLVAVIPARVSCTTDRKSVV